jgi:hypothetical protein
MLGAIDSRLNVQAPDRLSLRTNSGFRSVIIGRKRWDYQDGRWQGGPFPGLAVREVLMWYDAKNPRILRRLPNGDVDLAAYGLKPVPAWFRLTVERSGRVVEAQMTAPAHFMLHRYGSFDQKRPRSSLRNERSRTRPRLPRAEPARSGSSSG